MPIKMPPNYIEYCKKYSKLTPWTMYRYHKKPESNSSDSFYYAYADRVKIGTGDPTAQLQLLYALRSYPKKNDNSKYTLYVLATDGIYTEEGGFHAQTNEPIRFCNTYLQKLSDFNYMKNLAVNTPGTRMIKFIFNYKYQEKLNGKIMPNSFDFLYHKNEYPDIWEHSLIVIGDDMREPITIDYDETLYKAIKLGQTYLHLRSDNYIDFSLIDTYHPSF
jgi:hypothetical protein